ncbi:acyl-CoA N-acyltransferase [Atractiella rhizophila]|nr:acyl-CoA N-acyltransferase [Atractiella rhizophila]
MFAQIKHQSARLVFRPVDPAKDAKVFFELFDEAATFAGIGDPAPQSEKTWEKILDQSSHPQQYDLAICLAENEETKPGTVIGWMTLTKVSPVHRRASFALMIGNAYQRKGYGKEALTWLLEQAFVRCNCHKVIGNAFSWNEGALALYKSLGFKVEGVRPEHWWHEGHWVDDIGLGLLEKDWRAHNEKQ